MNLALVIRCTKNKLKRVLQSGKNIHSHHFWGFGCFVIDLYKDSFALLFFYIFYFIYFCLFAGIFN